MYPEFYPEVNEPDFTGRYLAVLLSIRGLERFYVASDENGNYIMDDDNDSETDRYNDSELEGILPDIVGIHTLL